MPNIVNPIKKAKLKERLLKGDDAKNAMLKAGFAPSTAHNATNHQVVKSCLAEISRDVKAFTTVESVLNDLYRVEELALKKGDYSTAKECIVWRGKWLAMFTDKQEVSSVEKEDCQFSLERLAKIRIASNQS